MKRKAKRRCSQQEPKYMYQTDRRLLQDSHVQEFARVLEEKLDFHTTCRIEESWSEFKKSIIEAQKELPLVPEKEERDLEMKRVREESRMKQEAWLKWAKKPDDTLLKAQNQQLKAESRKAANEAHKV